MRTTLRLDASSLEPVGPMPLVEYICGLRLLRLNPTLCLAIHCELPHKSTAASSRSDVTVSAPKTTH